MSDVAHTIADCEARSARIESQMRFMWIPGRRERVVEQSFRVGQDARELGATELAERNLHRAIDLMTGRRPGRSQKSLKTFRFVAGCHNQLGILYLDNHQSVIASAAFDRAIELRRELQRLSPKDRENEVYLGGALCNRGNASFDSDVKQARDYYQQSLDVLRQPTQTCECGYWDEERQSWWCSQLEMYDDLLNLGWVRLAPHFIDNAMAALRSLESPEQSDA
jgi:tetratricopeptide (TPR) repeat protein